MLRLSLKMRYDHGNAEAQSAANNVFEWDENLTTVLAEPECYNCILNGFSKC